MSMSRVPSIPNQPAHCRHCGAALPVAVLASDEPDLMASFALEAQDYTIGRETGCDLVLPGRPTFSRHHARLVWQGEQFEIQDTSTHGTMVDRIPLQPDERR